MKKYIVCFVLFSCIFSAKIQAQSLHDKANFGKFNRPKKPVDLVPYVNEKLVYSDVVNRCYFSSMESINFIDTIYNGFCGFVSEEKARGYNWSIPGTKEITAHVVKYNRALYVISLDTTYYCVLVSDVRGKVTSLVFFYDKNDSVTVQNLYGDDPRTELSLNRMLFILFEKLLVGIMDLPKESWVKK